MQFIFLLFSVLINKFDFTICNNFYGKWNNDFHNGMTLNIDIYFADISNVSVIDAIDSYGNQLFIETGNNFHINRTFVICFNGLKFIKHDVKFTLGFSMDFKIVNNNLYEDNIEEEVLLTDIFNRSTMIKNLTTRYSALNNKTNYNIHQLHINIFNGNQNSSSNNMQYQPNNIIGCIGYFRINDQIVDFETKSSYLLKLCYKKYDEVIHENAKKRVEKKQAALFDCSLASLNTEKFCFGGDLPIYNGSKNSYQIMNKNKNNIIKIAWRQSHFQKYCLIELSIKNKMLFTFHTNHKDVIMNMNNNNSLNCSQIIFREIVLQQIFVLLIQFVYPNITIKISNGKIVQTFIETMNEYPDLINIGFSSQSNKCQQFEDNLIFLSNGNYLKISYSINQKKSVSSVMIFSLSIMSLIIFSIICIGIHKIYYRKNEQEIMESNIYENRTTFPYENSLFNSFFKKVDYEVEYDEDEEYDL